MLSAWRAFALVPTPPLTAVTAAELRNPESHFVHQSLGDFKEELAIASTGDSGCGPLLVP